MSGAGRNLDAFCDFETLKNFALQSKQVDIAKRQRQKPKPKSKPSVPAAPGFVDPALIARWKATSQSRNQITAPRNAQYLAKPKVRARSSVSGPNGALRRKVGMTNVATGRPRAKRHPGLVVKPRDPNKAPPPPGVQQSLEQYYLPRIESMLWGALGDRDNPLHRARASAKDSLIPGRRKATQREPEAQDRSIHPKVFYGNAPLSAQEMQWLRRLKEQYLLFRQRRVRTLRDRKRKQAAQAPAPRPVPTQHRSTGAPQRVRHAETTRMHSAPGRFGKAASGPGRPARDPSAFMDFDALRRISEEDPPTQPPPPPTRIPGKPTARARPGAFYSQTTPQGAGDADDEEEEEWDERDLVSEFLHAHADAGSFFDDEAFDLRESPFQRRPSKGPGAHAQQRLAEQGPSPPPRGVPSLPRRRPREEEEEEEEEEEDSFIEDDEPRFANPAERPPPGSRGRPGAEVSDDENDEAYYEQNYGSIIQAMFGRPMAYHDDSDDENMETSYADMQREEMYSSMAGAREDAEELNRERNAGKRRQALLRHHEYVQGSSAPAGAKRGRRGR